MIYEKVSYAFIFFPRNSNIFIQDTYFLTLEHS